MAACRKAHEQEFFEQLLPSTHRKTQASDLYMPPRSRWRRVHKNKRLKNAATQYTKDLIYTVMQLRESPAPADKVWIDKQDELTLLVRNKALNESLTSFDPPRIFPIPKDKSQEYRVIASYSENLCDSIIIGQCAKYLRWVFDDYFLDCSFAFRFPKLGKPKTHHDAFEQLTKFWKDNQKNNHIQAYVAECDIQGFYDILNHEVIMDCYDAAVIELKQSGTDIDQRARQIITAYLHSYSYNNYGRPKAFEELKAKGIESPDIKDRDKTLEGFLTPGEDYGVPQGGALSVFFANLVLHNADNAVMKIIGEKSNSLYVRYCDDMLVATLEADKTKQALSTYIEELQKLKLKHHEPEEVGEYVDTATKRKFWATKTKSTYLWGDPALASAKPWLAFVGYQLRYDGMVRVRPSSIKKELKKQSDTTNKFLINIKKAKTIVRTKKYLLRSLEWRLRAGAIGKRLGNNLDEVGMDLSEFGWCNGFKNLTSCNLPESQLFVKTQLRHLDRGLCKQIRIARGFLAQYSDPDPEPSSKKYSKTKDKLKFVGKPRSYVGQLEIRSGRNIA